MGFRQDAYARIFSVNDMGKYSVANVCISKKNKNTNQYETEFQHGYVRLVGDAHEAAKELGLPTKESYNKEIHKGAPVKITSCDVTNKYDPTKKQTYWNCTIFGFENAEFNGGGNKNEPAKNTAKPKTNANRYAPLEDDGVQLPF